MKPLRQSLGLTVWNLLPSVQSHYDSDKVISSSSSPFSSLLEVIFSPLFDLYFCDNDYNYSIKVLIHIYIPLPKFETFHTFSSHYITRLWHWMGLTSVRRGDFHQVCACFLLVLISQLTTAKEKFVGSEKFSK